MQDAVKHSNRPEKKSQIDAYTAAGMSGLFAVGGELLLASKPVQGLVNKAGRAMKSPFGTGGKVKNPVPNRGARIRPAEFSDSPTLGPSNADDVFVTAADDLKGATNSTEIAKKLTMVDDAGGYIEGPFEVIEFDMPTNGIASPVNRSNPGFIGGGQTAGGAREFSIPNTTIDKLKNVIKKIFE
jgi:hypothetical protein